jgi:ethanolamine permease
MESHVLKKTLGPVQVWALAVGLVISGEYFGWSYGWSVSGTFGFLISTLAVALFFTTFIFSLTELSTSIPEAGGPYAYSQRALGKHWAHLTALLTLIEFIFAPPAIAFALGGYLHVLMPSMSAEHLALIVMLLFGCLNLHSLHLSARFELVVTILAVTELLIFTGVLLPHFQWSNFASGGWDHGTAGVFA